MSLEKQYKKADRFVHSVFAYDFSKKLSKHYFDLYKKNGIAIKPLTTVQKKKLMLSGKSLVVF